MNVFLSTQVAYPWTTEGSFSFRGYFLAEEQCWRASAAISYLRQRLTAEAPETVLRGLNGVFSVIWEREGEILFAVDRLRGLPLFYAMPGGELWVGDDAAALAEALPRRTLSPVAAEEYLSNGTFVSGSSTLLQELFQVQAAEVCFFDKAGAELSHSTYFRTEHGDFIDDGDVDALLQAFWLAYEKTGKNLVQALNGRTAVVPLSGGADSRMVLSMLKKEGYEKVFCFTYGREGNRESEISRAVAREFGYPWVMVPYTGKMWENLRNDPVTADYERFAFACSSTPHLQDFPAVKYLKEHHMIPGDSVFVPGHSGDIPNGNHVAALYLEPSVTKRDCMSSVERGFYSRMTPALEAHVFASHPVPEEASVQDYASVEEWFDTSERQAKYIVNSVRVYEFFGYEWLIPLWDNEQFDFWKRVSLSWRYRRKLYYFAVNDRLPSTNDATASKRLAGKVRQIPGLRTAARRAKRVWNYWTSPLCIEHFFHASVYWKACISAPPTFTSATLSSQRHLTQLKEELRRHEES